jgi:hypothetical protein
MKRLAVIALALAALAVPANARAALSFVFDQPRAAPNDRISLRAGGTPRNFTLNQRKKPFQRPVWLYLVGTAVAADVHSRFDSRLSFIGWVVLGRNGRGLSAFNLPPLDPGTYTLAYWCPGCAPYRGGRTFYVQDPAQFVEPYRSQALLQVETTDNCPVTVPNGSKPPRQPRSVSWYGNGLLWAAWLSPDGIFAVPPERVSADGSIGTKLFWVTSPPQRAPAISGQRVDGLAPPLRMLGANRGSFSGALNPSWATPVVFPTAGCWRVTARVRDLSLAYVVDVVVH